MHQNLGKTCTNTAAKAGPKLEQYVQQNQRPAAENGPILQQKLDNKLDQITLNTAEQ